MKRVNLVKGGVVVNSITTPDDWTGVDGQWQTPDGITAVPDDHAGVGDTYDGVAFHKPVPEIVEELVAEVEVIDVRFPD